MKESKQIYKAISSAKKVAIFAHKGPDPDAFGSMFGAREFCRALNVKADVFGFSDEHNFVKNIFPVKELKTDFHAKDYDLVILTDCHMLKRLDDCFVSEVTKSKNIMFVDHHIKTKEEDLAAQIELIMDNTASASEIWAQLFLDNNLTISPQTATYLYCGLMGDTDRFLHNNLSAHVFETAKTLFECGADIQFVYDEMYRKDTREFLKFQGVFYDKIEYVTGGAYVYFTLKDMKKYAVNVEDIKRFANSLVRIDGVTVSVLAYETEHNHFRFSLRSKSASCNKVAEKYGGGGHARASAFEIDITEKGLKKKMPQIVAEILND